MARKPNRLLPLLLLPVLVGQLMRLMRSRHPIPVPLTKAKSKEKAPETEAESTAANKKREKRSKKEAPGEAKAGKVKKTKFHGTLSKKVYCTPNKTRLLEAVGDYISEGANLLCVSLDAETLDVLFGLSKTGAVIHIDMDHGTPNAQKPNSGVRDLVIDAWDLRALQDLGVDFDVAVLDVSQWSGRDSILDTISLLNTYWQGLPTLQGIILRSKALLQVSQRLLDVGLLHDGKKRPRLFLEKPEAPEPPLLLPPDSPECLLAVGKVVCAVGVGDYRSSIPFVVREGDAILEIGCQAGLTTKLLRQANRGGRVVGSDVAASSIEHARQQGEGCDIEWVVLDAWDLSGIRTLGAWTILFVDVSGISGRNSVQDALALVLSYFRLLPTLRTVVIKSRCLRDLSGRFVPLQPREKGKAPAARRPVPPTAGPA